MPHRWTLVLPRAFVPPVIVRLRPQPLRLPSAFGGRWWTCGLSPALLYRALGFDAEQERPHLPIKTRLISQPPPPLLQPYRSLPHCEAA
jgi:hypothetical protein